MLKICGLQGVEVLKSIIHLKIDAFGFVFAPSRRRVTPEQAGAMLRWLREESGLKQAPLGVGVFVAPSMEELDEVFKTARLDVVQLHGGETPAICSSIKERFGVKVWKVLSLKSSDSAGDAEAIRNIMDAYCGHADAILLDTHDPIYGGGSGKSFAWHVIPAYQEEAHRVGLPLYVAGGLHADNVGELLARYRPDGVDVSSGVETDGLKDIRKICDFAERVRAYDNNESCS